MPSNFLKKSWSELIGNSKPISIRLGDITNRNKNNEEESPCNSPTNSDVSYLSSPPSPSCSSPGLKISLKSSFSISKRNSVPTLLTSNNLDRSTDSIECTPPIIIIPKEKSISTRKNNETPEFTSVTQLVQYFKQLESFCFCEDGKKMLIQALMQQKKDEQVKFIQLVDNIANNMESDADRVNVDSLRGICENICEQFLKDGSEFQLNVSNRFIRKFEKELNNPISQKEDYVNWIDSLHQEVILQINSETFSSIKKTEEFRVWLLSKALDWVSSQEGQKEKIEDMTISQFLDINDLSELEKIFKKKKLNLLSDIKHMTDQNHFKELGITKLGHQKRLARLVRQTFNYQ